MASVISPFLLCSRLGRHPSPFLAVDPTSLSSFPCWAHRRPSSPFLVPDIAAPSLLFLVVGVVAPLLLSPLALPPLSFLFPRRGPLLLPRVQHRRPTFFILAADVIPRQPSSLPRCSKIQQALVQSPLYRARLGGPPNIPPSSGQARFLRAPPAPSRKPSIVKGDGNIMGMSGYGRDQFKVKNSSIQNSKYEFIFVPTSKR